MKPAQLAIHKLIEPTMTLLEFESPILLTSLGICWVSRSLETVMTFSEAIFHNRPIMDVAQQAGQNVIDRWLSLIVDQHFVDQGDARATISRILVALARVPDIQGNGPLTALLAACIARELI